MRSMQYVDLIRFQSRHTFLFDEYFIPATASDAAVASVVFVDAADVTVYVVVVVVVVVDNDDDDDAGVTVSVVLLLFFLFMVFFLFNWCCVAVFCLLLLCIIIREVSCVAMNCLIDWFSYRSRQQLDYLADGSQE